ncbi:MAG TPA: bis-aminopropyl spermidine synthase family protein [Polyangiales bacterium]|nr:bis-aminopropyl spermidine synthase family protein [Polyangiales bacterium]
MYEGAFRILRALGDGRSRSQDEVVRAAGEASSVVREVMARYPQWFEDQDGEVRCSERGLAALARELVARGRNGDHGADLAPDWRVRYERMASERSVPKRALDQVYVTTDTAVRRATLLLGAGEHQRGLAFLGDDDLTSAAVQLAGAQRKITVLDTDAEILGILARHASALGWEHDLIEHDLRYPVPRKMKGRFGAVFTDPPYALEGFGLFVSRAVDLLKPDGRLYVCFGQSRRASERGLQKQRVLCEAGFLIEAVFEDFNEYHGAESIGSRSALWRCRVTPETRPLVRGEVEGPLYTSRPSDS